MDKLKENLRKASRLASQIEVTDQSVVEEKLHFAEAELAKLDDEKSDLFEKAKIDPRLESKAKKSEERWALQRDIVNFLKSY